MTWERKPVGGRPDPTLKHHTKHVESGVISIADKSSNLFTSSRKRLRIGYNSESFSVKSADCGINPPMVDEIATR